jgi:DNA repair exonuclease SbcCD ATPase subunit
MKRLEKVCVVQFFLFERQELLLDEITGIFGPNASGKSSMLDAVQIAMFGGNTRLTALNAQADEEQRTTRTLRAYCLGQYGESIEDRVRDNATTYITLVWRDTETNEPLTMGVCIEVSADRDGHEVVGRYLLPKYELHMSDHLEILDGQERPREWSTFRHQIMERGHVSGDEVLFHDAQRYINAVLLVLRGSEGVPHYESFTRAFRFALRMRFDKSVDQIVRNDVLEARPTNIKRFREVTDSFKRLAELVAQVEEKLTDGRRVEVNFAKAAEESRRTATWDAMGRMAAVEVANDAFNQASLAREHEEAALTAKRNKLKALGNQITEANEKSLSFRMAKEAHASHKDYGALQSEIQAAQQRRGDKAEELQKGLRLLCNCLREAVQSTFLQSQSSQLPQMLEPLETHLQGTIGLTRSDVDRILSPALRLAEQVYTALYEQNTTLKQQIKDADERLRDAKASLARVKEGRAPLAENVQRLMTELKDHGLHPTPVCDLVKITDADWQSSIESYLGINLQALLVSNAEEVDAFRIYRNLTGPRAVYGAKLARESRQQIGHPVEEGSVAELIEGTSPAAVAFLRRLLGDIQRVSTDSEALAGKRTLTQDGMLVSGGEIERLRPVPATRFMIGAGSEVHRRALERQIDVINNEITERKLSAGKLGQLVSRLQPFSNEELVKKSIVDGLAEIERANQEATSKSSVLAGRADEEYVLLGQQEQQWVDVAKTLGIDRDAINREVGGSETRLEALQQAEARAREEVVAASKTAAQAKAHPEYDHDYWLSQWDRVLESFDGKPRELVGHCELHRDRAEARMKEAISRGMREFGVFLQKYHEQTLMDTATDWRKAHAWLTETLERLDKTELAGFKAEMDAAYRTSQETFRNDVAMALYTNLEWLGETMDRLNAVLRTCPTFSNGERYRFRRSVRPHLETLLKFIKDVAAYGPTQDLFGGAGEIPEAFKALLDDKVMPGAGSQRSPLDDYREFFDFDIEILREDLISKDIKVVGHLSKRLGPGSGGEHRAPLYVIAGAALASAYRLDRGHRDGLRLMLLDEAFNKMDMTNIIATMRYLEELGLQVLMASPGENLGTLTAFLHRYYDILRDAENNTVMFEGHSVSEGIRALFRADLPEFNPGLVKQEVSTMRARLSSEAVAE